MEIAPTFDTNYYFRNMLSRQIKPLQFSTKSIRFELSCQKILVFWKVKQYYQIVNSMAYSVS